MFWSRMETASNCSQRLAATSHNLLRENRHTYSKCLRAQTAPFMFWVHLVCVRFVLHGRETTGSVSPFDPCKGCGCITADLNLVHELLDLLMISV